MDLRKIKALIELLEKSSLSELEIKEGEETVRLARHNTSYAAPPVYHQIAAEPVARPAQPVVAAPLSNSISA